MADLGFLAFVVHHFGQLLAPFLGQGGQVEADDGAGGVRCQAQVRGQDRLLHRADHLLFPWGDGQRARVGDGDAGDLAERHVRTVVVHLEVFHQGGRGAAGAHFDQGMAQSVDALGHAGLRVLLDVVEHGRNPCVNQNRPIIRASQGRGCRSIRQYIRSRVGRSVAALDQGADVLAAQDPQ